MTTDTTIELIKIIPSIIWALIVIVLLVVFYQPIKNLLPNVSEFKAFGVEATFIKNELDRAAQNSDMNTNIDIDADQVVRRAQRSVSVIVGARILIVNDVPEKMSYIISVLQSLKAKVDVCTSTTMALRNMRHTSYDAIISDIRRGNVDEEGLRFLEKTVKQNVKRPTIFLVANLDPNRGIPLHAFGITDRIDELFNLIFDALERVRG